MLEKNLKASLILENGAIFTGKAFGHVRESVGEVVFTTGMTGYQEAITDPSFAGQIVVMTYPLVGNYGINLEDMESKTPRLKGLIVREKCNLPNNWRCEMDLDGFLKQKKIIGIEGIDTRALTRVLRNEGTMKGIITVRDLTSSQISQNFNSCSNKNIVYEITTKEKYIVDGEGLHLAILDLGIKESILREFSHLGMKLTVFPASTTSEEILSHKPDALFVSNGAGNPEDYTEITNTIKQLSNTMPVIGIALGYQLIAKAFDCTIKRLKYGHHGANHPAKNLKTNKIYITSQSHEYVVDKLSDVIEATYENVNDNTIEGIKHKTKPIWGVQFNPEASAGPLDTKFLFEEILKIIEGGKNNA